MAASQGRAPSETFDGSTLYGGTVAGDRERPVNPTGKAPGPGPGKGRGGSYDAPGGRKRADAGDQDITASTVDDLPFVDAEQYLSTKRPFCVRLDPDRGGVVGALRQLDEELRSSGNGTLFSRKKPVQWTGREISPGNIGVYTRGGSPKLLVKSGRYPGFPFGWWWGRTWVGHYNLTETSLSIAGLTIVSVSQNQAAVCQDPQNQVFVVKTGGFVALAVQGEYKVLDIIDQTHLAEQIVDKYTKTVLAFKQDVLMGKPSGLGRKYVAATFLDIPANNVVILQRENQLFELGAGQHHITHANVKIRGAFTRGEVQHELVVSDVYTRDQVPVMMRVYLRWELQHPLLLTRHGYQTPFDALQDKTRSILTQVLGHLDYSSMAKQRNIGSDINTDPNEPREDVSAAFVDAVRVAATDDLSQVAVEYGIHLKDLAIVDRQFKGEIALVMDGLVRRALEAQVESSNLDRENLNRTKKEQGALRVAEIQNQQRQAKAETDAQAIVVQAKARAEALRIDAEAQAQATRIAAVAASEAFNIQARADAGVADDFARECAKARIEVERTGKLGDKTVFFPTDMGHSVGGALLAGTALDVGRKK